jgi:hypothetical protein
MSCGPEDLSLLYHTSEHKQRRSTSYCMSRRSCDETAEVLSVESISEIDEDERFLEPLGKASHDRRPLHRTSVFGLTRPASQRP